MLPACFFRINLRYAAAPRRWPIASDGRYEGKTFFRTAIRIFSILNAKPAAMKRNSLLAVLIFASCLLAVNRNLLAMDYYVDNLTGDDQNTGTTPSQPWKSLQKLMQTVLDPGDVVHFAKGASWEQAQWEAILLIEANGNAEQPIRFTSYGEGQKPRFSNGGQVWNKGIQIRGNHLVIEGLHVTRTGYCGFEIAAGAQHNIIRDCEVDRCGIGILCRGAHNLLTKNYIHDLVMIVDNEIPDTRQGGGDFGCVAFWLYGPHNEISYNKAYNNRGHSHDYQFDGGFLEFYENCDGTYAHHNWSEVTQGIVECSNGHGNDVLVAYNVFIESMGMFALHLDNFSISNFRFENNTCLTREGTLWNNMLMTPDGMTIRNNIFVLGGDADEVVARTNAFTHQYNLYFLLDSAGMGDVVQGEGERCGDPLFVDIDKHDFRLLPGSPAIDAGVGTGSGKDFKNHFVPAGEAQDIGAFEYVPLDFTAEPAPKWTALFERTSGWFGADGVFSIPLDGRETQCTGSPDRKTLFIFSDTYIGEVVNNIPQPGTRMVNNSAAWLTGTGPDAGKITFTCKINDDGTPSTYFVPGNRNAKPGEYFWLGDGFVNPAMENALYLFAYHVEMTGPNVFDFAQTEIALLKIRDPSPQGFLAYEQFATDLGFVHPVHGRVYFGSGVFVNTSEAKAPEPDGYVYIYGIMEKEKSLIAARVRPGQIEDFSRWTFWDGRGWSDSNLDVAPITNAVSNELSVTPSGDGRYLLTFTVLGLSDKVGIRVGTSPVGPFGEIYEVYTCPEYAEKGLLPYNAKAHYHLSKPGRLLVSYNTITFDFWEDIQKDATIYHPRFIWVNY